MDWVFDQGAIDWTALSELYRIAPLNDKAPDHLRLAFSNSMYKCFVFDGPALIGAGRAVADGIDCAYLCDIAVHPDFQGRGLGAAIVRKLQELCSGYRKIILYANPGKEAFYKRFGFRSMRTAMALFQDQKRAIDRGLIDAD